MQTHEVCHPEACVHENWHRRLVSMAVHFTLTHVVGYTVPCLSVQIVVIIDGRSTTATTKTRFIWPIDRRCSTTASGLRHVHWVKLLSELIEFCEIVSGHGPASTSESFFEMLPADLAGDVSIHCVVTSSE